MSEEKITQLTEKEKVRKKISVWLGASNHVAVVHTVKEIVGNSVDEINKGNGNKIKITRHNEKTLTIEDNAKGLPIEGKSEDGVDNHVLLFETLFAGTKYGNGVDNQNYTVGVNGVFNTVLAFSSQDVTFEVARPNGNVYSVSYQKGEKVKPLEIIGKSDSTYTKITYTLDDDIFEDNYFTLGELRDISSQQASLINGSIEVIDKETDSHDIFFYENGIVELLEEMNSNKKSLTKPIIIKREYAHAFKKEGKEHTDDIKINMAIDYTEEDIDNTQIEFLNGSNLLHHGSIHDGLVNGLRTIFNNYIKKNNLYNKNEKQITKEDVLTGLNYIIDFKSYFPVYANQTKFASYVKYYEKTMKDVLSSFFEPYIIENKEDMDTIVSQVLANKRSREKAEKTRVDVRKKLSKKNNSITSKIEGYYPPKSKNKEERILAICEGRSALSSMLDGRDINTYGIYPIRGKTLNVYKASNSKIAKDKLITDLYSILGCGMELEGKRGTKSNNFDIENLQFDKIAIFADADEDGVGSILPLLLVMFERLSPELLKRGKIYYGQTPKYEVKTLNEEYYAFNNKEFEEIKEKIGSQKYEVNFVKGLGELNQQGIAMCMRPEAENLLQITAEKDESVDILKVFMGKNVDKRREIILDSFREED